MGGSVMTALEIILTIAIAVLLIILCILTSLFVKQKHNISNLQKSINDFITNGSKTDFSVSDNDFSQLQNSVADLENMIILEKNNTFTTTKKNTEFISDISHQLKTPLAGLRLYCEMQDAESPCEYTKKELILIEKMENLIKKLLRLEKIKSDSYTMEFKPCEINELINEALFDFKHLFPKKQFNVTGQSVLRCDKAYLTEAIGNIIKNACEHTEESGTVDIRIEDSERSTIIEINDNGGGMPEEELPNLFVRFYHAENSHPSSAGIGLAITKAIVEKHHGIITAENKNGGLLITMCFPHIDGIVTI